MTKNPGDGVYSGSTCKQGEIEGVVIATGVHTFFGKAAHLVENTNHVGHFQMVSSALLMKMPHFRCILNVGFPPMPGFDLNRELLHMLDCSRDAD